MTKTSPARVPPEPASRRTPAGPPPPVRVQIGKLKEICARWGVTPRELDKLVEAGAVRPSAPASGKGSLRLLDARSLCDVFFAHCLKGLGVRPEHLVRVIEHLRSRYQDLLTRKPEQLIIGFAPRRRGHAGPAGPEQVWPKLIFDTRPLLRGVDILQAVGRVDAEIHRGRPKGNWRATFRGAVAQLSTEMQDRRISEDQIDAAIDAVRADRRRKVQEEIVTLPPP